MAVEKSFLQKKSKEIKRECDEMLSQCLAKSHVGTSSMAGFYKLYEFEKIKLGRNELVNRKNSRITWISLVISIFSLFIALVALYVANQNSRANVVWEDRQIKILNTINKNLLEEKGIFLNLQEIQSQNMKNIENINNILLK